MRKSLPGRWRRPCAGSSAGIEARIAACGLPSTCRAASGTWTIFKNPRRSSPLATSTYPVPLKNPLTAGTPKTLLPQPCVLVIFGAAGDLSWRKLLPAVYNLNVDGVLPSNFAVVGFGIGAEGNPDDW